MKKLVKRVMRPVAATLALVIVAGSGYGATVAMKSNTTPPENKPSTDPTSQQKVEADASNSASLDNTSEESTMQPVDPVDDNQDKASRSVVNHTSVTSTTDNGRTSVKVNGRDIKVPKNGTVHKTITDSNGQTSVDIDVSGNGQNDDSNSSSTSVNLNISSESSSLTD